MAEELSVPTSSPTGVVAQVASGDPLVAPTATKPNPVQIDVKTKDDAKSVVKTLRITTFNILADCWIHYQKIADASIRAWEARVPKIAKVLLASASDILCLQEVDQKTYDALVLKLAPKYVAGPFSANETKKEIPAVGTCIFARSELLGLTFETKTIVKRGCTGVSFADGIVIWNVHWSWELESQKKQNQADAMAAVANAMPKLGLWVGDFNMVKAEMKAMVKTSVPKFEASLDAASDRITCWNPNEPNGGRHLDYVLHGADIKVVREEFDTSFPTSGTTTVAESHAQCVRLVDLVGSDHFPLTVTLEYLPAVSTKPT